MTTLPPPNSILAGVPDAQAYFEAFPRSVKRSILEWIASAKTGATRAKRVEQTARLAGQNIRANQWRDKRDAGTQGRRDAESK